MQIIHGDCLSVMATLEPNTIDAIVTDPPYGLEFMGKEWDRLYERTEDCRQQNKVSDNPNLKGRKSNPISCTYGKKTIPMQSNTGKEQQSWHYAWAVEALRVAKPGCHLLAFGGTRTFHRLACAIEDAGWEIRDCLGWLYGSGFPKSYNLKGEHEGWGTALKPAWEPIILARKPLEGTVAENVQKWGTGAINVDGCRVGTDTHRGDRYNDKPSLGGSKNNYGVHHSKAWNVPPGRWPANLIHDGGEEVLELFPTSSITGNRRIKNRIQQEVISTPFTRGQGAPEYTDSGSAARFFYCTKASRAEREMGCEGMPQEVNLDLTGGDRNRENERAGTNRNGPLKAANHHPTVKPLALMCYLCRLITPPNGRILDPFMGSGTTGMAANLEGFRFMGIEKEKEYVEIAERRIEATA